MYIDNKRTQNSLLCFLFNYSLVIENTEEYLSYRYGVYHSNDRLLLITNLNTEIEIWQFGATAMEEKHKI